MPLIPRSASKRASVIEPLKGVIAKLQEGLQKGRAKASNPPASFAPLLDDGDVATISQVQENVASRFEAIERKLGEQGKAISALEAKHEKDMEGMEAKHEKDMEGMEAKHEKDMEGMEARHTFQLELVMKKLEMIEQKSANSEKENKVSPTQGHGLFDRRRSGSSSDSPRRSPTPNKPGSPN